METVQIWKRTWLEGVKNIEQKKGVNAEVLFVSAGEKWNDRYFPNLPAWLKGEVSQKKSMLHAFNSTKSLVRILTPPELTSGKQQNGQFDPTLYSLSRDIAGTCLRELMSQKLSSIKFVYYGNNLDELKGIVVGIEMAAYSFKQLSAKSFNSIIKLSAPKIKKDFESLKAEAITIAQAVNLSRYLVDLPPSDLNPKTFTDIAQDVFARAKNVSIEVWDSKRLFKENMHLHLSVGKASETPSQLLILRYRGDDSNKEVGAFVGKGVTFDSGGLDIKPSSGMRYMKKDMGGAASLLGLAFWASQQKVKMNLDFYFSLAENSISGNSMRPGDILKSRSGKTVEIHNTDAEGRLVMSDSLALAAEVKPKFIINLATLTGAIKVALGSQVAGLFSNSDNLANELLSSAKKSGEGLWHMPLIPFERKKLKSELADLVNAHEGFGGAVTAALFLEEFVQGIPWAHIDMYSWVDAAEGAYAHRGGNGQFVQMLSYFLKMREKVK